MSVNLPNGYFLSCIIGTHVFVGWVLNLWVGAITMGKTNWRGLLCLPSSQDGKLKIMKIKQ
jgi:hypothetical protein